MSDEDAVWTDESIINRRIIYAEQSLARLTLYLGDRSLIQVTPYIHDCGEEALRILHVKLSENDDDFVTKTINQIEGRISDLNQEANKLSDRIKRIKEATGDAI
jgi:hypothetical protein